MASLVFEVLETEVVTGHRTHLAEIAGKALTALSSAEVPHAVIGATALAARGLPRHTADLDVVVSVDDAFPALSALESVGFRSATPVVVDQDPEPMYVLSDRGVDVDVLVAGGEPESTVIAHATPATVFGIEAPVATLEHLLLMYLYSNQPRHLGDFATIVTRATPDVVWVERFLSDVHPEMLPDFRDRMHRAKSPPPAPERPKRRRR